MPRRTVHEWTLHVSIHNVKSYVCYNEASTLSNVNNMPVCELCEAESFDLIDGLYYCQSCGTQSQVNRYVVIFTRNSTAALSSILEVWYAEL